MTSPIDQLRSLLEKATPGPWYPVKGGSYPSVEWRGWEYSEKHDREWTVSPNKNQEGWCTDSGHTQYCIYEDDAQLIALLRNLAPKFLELWEAVKWHLHYHPDDTIEMVTNAFKALESE